MVDATELPRLVTDLFKVIAIEESDLERLRQVFSHMREFTQNQRALFEIFDTTKDGKVSAEEMLKFMQDNMVNDVVIGDCKEIIAEFDSTQDGTLNYDEFLNCFLPAADYNLRNIEYYPDPRSSPFNSGGLPSSVPAMAARILDREKTFITRRREVRAQLARATATDLNKVFRDMSRGNSDIQIQDLVWFFDQYGFQAKTEDLEAILRRCDHDADRSLSLEEFAEALSFDYDKLVQDREQALAAYKAERDAKIEAYRQEQEAKRLEWEAKLEQEKLEREKRLEELRAQEELARLEREKQLEAYKLEREKQIEEWRAQQEAARLELEKKMELEKLEREKRAEQIRLEQEAARAEYEKKLELEKLERDKRIEEMRAEQERVAQER